MDIEEFAAARGARLDEADEELRPLVAAALTRFDDAGWEDLADAAAVLWLEMFEDAAPKAYQDAALAGFRKDLIASLKQTAKPDDPPADYQVNRVTQWVSSFTTNNATYQGAFASGQRRKQWVSRHDDVVRDTHKHAHGQQVPIGGTFEVAGVKLHYPGEPVGPPEVWINCRCLVRGVGRGVVTAAATDEEDFEDRTGVCVVALAADADPITAASSEDIVHATMLWFGDMGETDGDILEQIRDIVGAWAAKIDGPLAETVSGIETLGDDEATVAMISSEALGQIRDGMLEDPVIAAAHDAVEQFPQWTPHVTLGYPETPPLAEYSGTEITFDRLALWVGNDRTEFPLGGEMTASAATLEGEPDVEVDEEEFDGEDLVDDALEIPFHGVLAPIGVPSGDGRQLGMGKDPETEVTWRNLPIPMLYQTMTGDGGHVNSVVIGTIRDIYIEDNLVKYSGMFNSSSYVAEVVSGLADGSIRGVSIDVDQATLDQENSTDPDDFEAYMNGSMLTVFKTSRIAAATVVAIPAFPEAYMALGDCDCERPGAVEVDEDVEVEPIAASAALEFAPGTKDGPGWITHPRATARIRRYWTHGKGALKIKWGVPGDFNRCRMQLAKYVKNPDWLAGLCANMHKEALGVWPGQEGGGRHEAKVQELAAMVAAGGVMSPSINLVASAAEELLPSEWFANPGLTEPTQLTMTDEGRVYGHLATWGTCHIGITGVCTTPPYSSTDYAMFHTGYVETDKGDISVGHLTQGIGHAGPRVSMAAATAHYDRLDAIWADVVVGEDAIGIWFSGALRPDLSDKKRREIKAAGALSGDWRAMRSGLELVGAVTVGTPGFPIPRVSLAASGQHQLSLVAAGIVTRDATFTPKLDIDTQMGIVRAVADEVEYRQARRARLAEVRQREMAVLRPARIARAKRKV